MARNFKPKHLSNQTIVITEGAFGIGHEVAKLAAARGAHVVLGSKNIQELEKTVTEIIQSGGKALAVPIDVTKFEDLLHLQSEAIRKFQKIDAWVNSAGCSIFGYLLESNTFEEKKVFDINFWGTKHGSLVAVNGMKDDGGVLINLGNEISVAAQPLLGIYSASKNAVKAFTESLRFELKDRELPIELCLVRPSGIESSEMEDDEQTNIMYKQTAESIIKCLEKPERDVYTGGPAKLSAILDTFFPQVKDLMAETKMKEMKQARDKNQ